MNPRVSIIILNWKGWMDTIECLESLYRITYPNYDVIIVDNNSMNESIKKIIEYAQRKIEVNTKIFENSPNNKPIKVFEVSEDEAKQGRFNRSFYEKCDVEERMILIKNRDNYGYTGGNNVAIKFALSVLNPNYILILNNDLIVDEEFLKELVLVGERDRKAGIMGPTIYHYEYKEQNKIQVAGFKLHWNTGNLDFLRTNEIDNGQCNEIEEVDCLPGSAILARKELFERIGYFDTNYFMYWDEIDWCIRANKAGYKLLCVPTAKIWHKGAASTKKISGFQEYYLTRNRFWFMRRHATSRQYGLFLLSFFSYQFLFSAILMLSHKDIRAFMAFVRGAIDGISKANTNVALHQRYQ
jgi:hypothetical protein